MALLARKFIDYIGGGLSRCSRSSTVPHYQGSCEVWLAVYLQVNDSVCIRRNSSSLDDASKGITFFLISFMEESSMVEGYLLFFGCWWLGCGSILVHFLFYHLFNQVVSIAIVSKKLANSVKLSVGFSPAATMCQSSIYI